VVELKLTRQAAAPNNSDAKAELEFGGSGPVRLQVGLEDFPAGDYKLMIADVLRGTISISGASAVLTYRVNPVGAEQPLDFPTVGQSILISEGSTELFSGVLPTPSSP
jgi:hypothetical protein